MYTKLLKDWVGFDKSKQFKFRHCQKREREKRQNSKKFETKAMVIEWRRAR